ncbi:MAG: LysR family transcriptional regulator [Pseudomonadota bacterium]
MEWSALPPLSQLRAFEAAARLGGLSAAGAELNVTHAAVGQQIRKLEMRLGHPLARREGRGLAITPEGRLLAAQLTEAFEKMRAALAAFEEEARERPVRITLTPMFSASWLAPRIGAFRNAHPMIELMLNPTPETVDIVAGGYDLAIRYGVGDWPGLESEPLLASHHMVAASPSLLKGREVKTPHDLLGLPWIQEAGTDEWGVWLASHGVERAGEKRDVLHLPGNMTLDAIRGGQGVGMIARALVEDDIAAGRLVLLFEDDRGAETTGYHLVRRPGPLREPAAKVADWLRREARRDDEAAGGGGEERA